MATKSTTRKSAGSTKATNAKATSAKATTSTSATAPADRLAEMAIDALYISVGASVLAFQRAQVQRVELTKAIEQRVAEGRKQFADMTKAASTTAEGQLSKLDERTSVLEARFDEMLEGLQTRLPKPAAELLGQARSAAKTTRGQVRELLNIA